MPPINRLGDLLRSKGIILILGASIIGLSLLLAFKGNTSLLWPVAVWAVILLGIVIYAIRPTFMEILLFLFPLLWPAIPALTKLAPNWVAFGWVVLVAVYYYVTKCNNDWDRLTIKPHYAFFFILYTVTFVFSVFVNPQHERALSFMFQTVILVVIYWIFVQVLRGVNLNRALIAMIVGSVVNALIFSFAFLKSTPQFTLQGIAYGQLRPDLLGVNANHWPVPSIIGLALILSLAVHGKVRPRDWILILPTGVLLLSIALLNVSRSALLGIFLSAIFILITHYRWRKILLHAFTLFGIVAFVIISTPLLSKIEVLLRIRSGLAGRDVIWGVAWRVIEDNPILGVGPANFKELLFFKVPFCSRSLAMIVDQPSAHNVFLQIGTEIGLAGTIIAIALLVYFCYRSSVLWQRLKKTSYLPVLVAITALMIGGLVRSFFAIDFTILHGAITMNIKILLLLAIQDELSFRSSFNP